MLTKIINVLKLIYSPHRHKPLYSYKNKFKSESISFIKPLILGLPCLSLDLKLLNGKISQNDVEENVSHLIALARIALEKGDVERAEAILEMGLKVCEEYNSFVAIPYMYDILTTIAFARGNFKRAELLIVNVIEKLILIGTPENDSHIIEFKLRLARIYSARNENELAEIGFQSCLNAQNAKITQGDVSSKTGMLYVNTLFWFGLHKIQQNDFKTARRMISNAYDFSTKIKGLSPYQEMVILYTLADLNMELDDFDVALNNMQSAILLGKGIGSTDLPRYYVKLAKIFLKLTAWDSAQDSAWEGYKLAGLFNEQDVQHEAEQLLKEIDKKITNK